MNGSFEFPEVTHFTAGAVGEPGQRVFYLQVGDGASTVTVKLEKQQVQALAQYLRSVLDDLPAAAGPVAAPDLQNPTDAEWTVGQIAVGVDENDAKVVLVIEELLPDEDDDLSEVERDLAELLDEPQGGRIRAHIDVGHAAGFISVSDDLMNRGRPPCRLCGQPVDPAGHACPRLN
jgi:uncharacterized repeat protein (TIGR03847 family)